MDAVGHVLLGIAVSGKLSLATAALSLAPDLSALPLQVKSIRDNIERYPTVLLIYQLAHSPLALLLAWFLPDPGFLIIATHIVADMFTHHPPYSFLRVYQWNYSPISQYFMLTALLATMASARLFFFPAA